MDIVGTVSVMAAAYGYYKAGVYVADTVDKSIRVYTFCKNAVGYIRRPIRYYLDSDSDSVNSYPDIPPRPFSCSNIDKSDEFLKEVDEENDEARSDPGENRMSKTIADISEFKQRSSNRIDLFLKKANRETSISTCSDNTEMCSDEILRDVSWVLVKNPDYSSDDE